MKHTIHNRPKRIQCDSTGFIYWQWRTGGYDAEQGDYERCADRESAAKIIRRMNSRKSLNDLLTREVGGEKTQPEE